MAKEKIDPIALRTAYTEQLSNQLERDGYRRNDLTVSANTANTLALVTALPWIAIHLVVYGLVAGWKSFSTFDIGLLSALILLSIIIHELIHGLFFGLFAARHFKAIKFGVMWKSLNPYCFCADPVSKVQYMIALVMPGFILGTCLGVLATCIGSSTLLVLSLVSYLAAGGDLFVAYKIMRFPIIGKKALFLDHPTQPGLLVFTNETKI